MAAAVFLMRIPPGSTSGVGSVSSSSGRPCWMRTAVKPFGTVYLLRRCEESLPHAENGGGTGVGRGLSPAVGAATIRAPLAGGQHEGQGGQRVRAHPQGRGHSVGELLPDEPRQQ